jgi:flagellar basal body-associated protein FliL
MQSNIKNKTPKILDIKILITTIAVAVMVVFWNLFSNNAYAADKQSPDVVITLPPQTPAVAADILPPLPTIVPIVDVTLAKVGSAAKEVSQPVKQDAQANNIQPTQQATPLRVVGIPTMVIKQKFAPVVNSAAAAPAAADSSSGGSSNKKSKTKTKSS